MKKESLCIVAVAACCLLASCHVNVKDKMKSVKEELEEQPMTMETRQVAPFERIRLLGSPTVCYTQSDSVSLRVEAPADLLEYVEAKVCDGTLTVEIRKGRQRLIPNFNLAFEKDVRVFVTSPDLIGVQVEGSGDFTCDGHLDTDNLNVELRGSGYIYFRDVICDNIGVTLVGSGDINVANVVAIRSDMNLMGSGDLHVGHDSVTATNILLNGSGDIKASFRHGGDVKSELRGSGDITLSGRVRSLQKTVHGSGEHATDGLSVEQQPRP